MTAGWGGPAWYLYSGPVQPVSQARPRDNGTHTMDNATDWVQPQATSVYMAKSILLTVTVTTVPLATRERAAYEYSEPGEVSRAK